MCFKWMGCRLERANCVGRECGRFSLFLFFSPLLVFQSPWAYSHGHFVCTLEPTGGFIYARPKTKPVLACSYRVPPFPGATTKKNRTVPCPSACVCLCDAWYSRWCIREVNARKGGFKQVPKALTASPHQKRAMCAKINEKRPHSSPTQFARSRRHPTHLKHTKGPRKPHKRLLQLVNTQFSEAPRNLLI